MLTLILLTLVAFSSVIGQYANEETLDGQGRYILRWNLLPESESIEFEVEADTTGFVGFGISPSGTMTGADIFIGGVHSNGTIYGEDRHGTGFTMPTLDAQQDWNLISAQETLGNKTFLRFSRKLNTCDDQDYPIGNDTNRLIWALGESDTLSYHGPTQRGSKSTNLLQVTPPDVDLSDYSNFTISINATMPALDTSYWCTFHKGPPLSGKHHVVAFDTLLPSLDAFQHTHHFVVFVCHAPPGSTDEETFDQYTNDKGVEGDHCHSTKTLPVQYCRDVLHSWAKGGKIMLFPEFVGFPTGRADGASEYYMVELHYDNPERFEGKRFVTGLEVFYTDQLRPIDAGFLALGQNVDISLTVPPSTDNFSVVGHCSPECTLAQIPTEGITAFASLLHSHKSGRKMRTRHFRGAIELPWLDSDEHYDFDFQQNKLLPSPRVILPGDQLSVECVYSSTWKGGEAVIGGYSTYEEMCQNLLWYYPAVGIGCLSLYNVDKHLAEFGVTAYHTVEGVTGTGYVIDEPEHLAGDYYDLVSTKFNWTEDFLSQYANERLNGEQESDCGRPARYPENFEEYVPVDVCGTR